MLTVALGLLAETRRSRTLVSILEPRFAFFPMAGESVTPRDFGVDYDLAAVQTRDGERCAAGCSLTQRLARVSSTNACFMTSAYTDDPSPVLKRKSGCDRW